MLSFLSGNAVVALSAAADLTDLFHQRVAQKRLLDNRHIGACRACTERRIEMADDENGWRCNFALAQARNQVHAAHLGHPLVDDKTAAFAKLIGGEEFGRTAINPDNETFELKRKFQRITNGGVVVDDGDDGYAFRFRSRFHF